MRVLLKAYTDRSFKFSVRPPPSSWFIKKAAGLPKASDKPMHNVVGRVSIKYLYEIAKTKLECDIGLKQQHDVEGIVMQLMAQCSSMGIDVVEDTLPPEPLFIKLAD